MQLNPYAPQFENLPQTLAVFPLPGVLLLPSGNLPLNIFEPRYLKMVDDALAGNRMIGMIQPRDANSKNPELFAIGCAGKITDFSETVDGRYLVTLTGVSRFKIKSENQTSQMYRTVTPDWAPFKDDIKVSSCLDVDREKLYGLLENYFDDQGFDCEWNMIEEATDGRLITCLSMICPFDAKEKQALLEAPCCKTRSQMFMTMLEMAVHQPKSCCDSKH